MFNTSKGIDAGFADEDAYAVYDKPWRDTDNVKNVIYRPSKNIDKEYNEDFEKQLNTRRFVPDKGFQGADKTESRGEGPVAFEQHHDANFDPFQIDDFLGNLKKGGAADKNSGSSKRKQDDYDDDSSGHKRSHKVK